jgi:hypothetical protein
LRRILKDTTSRGRMCARPQGEGGRHLSCRLCEEELISVARPVQSRAICTTGLQPGSRAPPGVPSHCVHAVTCLSVQNQSAPFTALLRTQSSATHNPLSHIPVQHCFLFSSTGQTYSLKQLAKGGNQRTDTYEYFLPEEVRQGICAVPPPA